MPYCVRGNYLSENTYTQRYIALRYRPPYIIQRLRINIWYDYIWEGIPYSVESASENAEGGVKVSENEVVLKAPPLSHPA